MIMDFIFTLFNKLIDIISGMADFFYNLLPDSPFLIIENSSYGDLLAKINYFIPIYEFVAIMETWLVAIAIWYIYSIFARWIKAIE